MWSTERLSPSSRVGNSFFSDYSPRYVFTCQIAPPPPPPPPPPPATTVKPNWIKERKQLCPGLTAHTLCPRINWKYYVHVSTIFFTKGSAILKKMALSCSLKSAFSQIFFICFLLGVFDTSGKIIIIYRFSNWNYARNHYTVSSSPNQ